MAAAAAGSSPVSTTEAGRGGKLKALGFLCLVVGGIITAVAYGDEASRERLGFSYLMGFVVCWAVVLGSLFFVALQHVTRSVWSVTMRRVAEMLASPMWLIAVLFLPLLAFALTNKDLGIFAWLRPEEVKAQHVPNAHTMDLKAPYLNESFFYLRTALFFGLWIAFTAFFVRGSKRQDATPPSSNSSALMQRFSGPFMVIFAFTLTFASFDWLMALRMDWFSTIYGVYVFSGVVLSGLAAITIAVMGMRAKGYLPKDLVRSDHLYSLGALLFAFTCFWGYISVSQFMLIWYANIPEETVYYIDRIQNGWLSLTWIVAILRFGLPFLLLLGRGSKTNPRRLVTVSLLILVGQVLDTYWLIMPEASANAGPSMAWFDVGPLLFIGGALLVHTGLWMARNKNVAIGDPLFEQSRNFHL
jgi:hypothetical protein